MRILSQEFNQFLSEILEFGIENVWMPTEDNIQNSYTEEYSHINCTVYEIKKNLIIQTKTNKYYELMHGYSNGQYALELNKLDIESIKAQTMFFENPIEYSKFEFLCDLNIRSIKPEVQIKISNEVKLKSLAFYSDNKFEFAVMGGDNLKTHKKLDKPIFDGCWLILDKEIIELNK